MIYYFIINQQSKVKQPHTIHVMKSKYNKSTIKGKATTYHTCNEINNKQSNYN